MEQTELIACKNEELKYYFEILMRADGCPRGRKIEAVGSSCLTWRSHSCNKRGRLGNKLNNNYHYLRYQSCIFLVRVFMTLVKEVRCWNHGRENDQDTFICYQSGCVHVKPVPARPEVRFSRSGPSWKCLLNLKKNEYNGSSYLMWIEGMSWDVSGTFYSSKPDFGYLYAPHPKLEHFWITPRVNSMP